ncbi:MAG: carboxypeptidase-like regulatory domain-containing protein, partial [Planctomycetaceae bacterium]
AIIRFVSAAPQNTGGDALWLSVVSTTDERGRYSFPPMPAGAYEVNVNSRLADPGRRDELKGNRGPYGSRRDLHARLNTVIPSKTVSLVDDEDAPQIDLFGVPTNTIRVKITQDEPVKTQPKRAPLIPITGTFGGKRWSGYSIPSVPNQSATFLVPKGLENASIKFSYALVKYPGDKEFLNATSIDIPRVDTNLDGYAIHLTSLARIKAKILLSDELSISKVGVLSIYLTECARHKSSGGKHFGRMEVGGRTNKFSTTLPPNVRFRLHVEAKQRSLHTQELTLKPGEVRQLEIDLRKVK